MNLYPPTCFHLAKHISLLLEVTCSNQKPQHVDFWGVPWRGRITLDETARYSCVKDYKKPVGFDLATCTREGWTPNPLCQATAKSCNPPPKVENSIIKASYQREYFSDSEVHYTCKAYHTLEGGPYRTCKNGKWIGEMKCLKPCTVDEEAMRSRNIRFRYTSDDKLYLVHLQWIEFTCTGGTSHVGPIEMRQMCVDGVMLLPTCQ
uniref:Sushi domain-containing protein n=1 Tax=Gasterosteus aculeatus aculeatus TaxID=481459 RepID=A0AAQ4RXJ9_GASAC